LGEPIWTKDPKTGEYHAFQKSSQGGLVPITPPEGQQLVTPGELAQTKTEATSLAKATATAKAGLQRFVDTAQTNIDNLEAIRTHPGRQYVAGNYWKANMPDAVAAMRSPDAIDFRQRMSQASRQAFLTAYETMRGAGQISNVEGEEGKGAINRMSAAQSPNEFDAALDDAEKIYRLGMRRARNAASGDFSEHPPEAVPSDYIPGKSAAPAASSATDGTAQPKSKAEFDALPSGTEYIDPKGQRRRKP
jgi:hypothetical protein